MPLQFKTPIYHITHLDNLARIIRTNGLWCDGERVRQGFDSVGIAHASLKTRRSQTPVPVAAKGTLNDYVPFYFAVRSPMLFSIHTGFVEGYDGGQKRVIYLVSSMEQVENGDRKWCFTDGHAVESFTRFFDDGDKIDKINWEVINSWRWKNTENDPDRKRKKQAEFLVHKSMPWAWIESIGVIDRTIAAEVQAILDAEDSKHCPKIVIEPRWYY